MRTNVCSRLQTASGGVMVFYGVDLLHCAYVVSVSVFGVLCVGVENKCIFLS